MKKKTEKRKRNESPVVAEKIFCDGNIVFPSHFNLYVFSLRRLIEKRIATMLFKVNTTHAQLSVGKTAQLYCIPQKLSLAEAVPFSMPPNDKPSLPQLFVIKFLLSIQLERCQRGEQRGGGGGSEAGG